MIINGPDQTSNEEGEATIFVGGIKGNQTEEVVLRYFSEFGPVKSVQMKKKLHLERGRQINCGFCTVIFEDRQDAQKVLNKSPHYIEERLVSCRPFLQGQELTQSKTHKDSNKLYVCNLSRDTKNIDMLKVFSKYGALDSAYTISDQQTGFSKGFGFVTYQERNTYESVLGLHNQLKIKGRKVKIYQYVEKKDSCGDSDEDQEMRNIEPHIPLVGISMSPITTDPNILIYLQFMYLSSLQPKEENVNGTDANAHVKEQFNRKIMKKDVEPFEPEIETLKKETPPAALAECGSIFSSQKLSEHQRKPTSSNYWKTKQPEIDEWLNSGKSSYMLRTKRNIPVQPQKKETLLEKLLRTKLRKRGVKAEPFNLIF